MKGSARRLIRVFASIAIALIAVGASTVAETLPSPDSGLHLEYRDGEVVIASVDYGSVAQRAGLRAGEVVVQADGNLLLLAPDQVKRDVARSGEGWTDVAAVPRDQVPGLKAAQVTRRIKVTIGGATAILLNLGGPLPWRLCQESTIMGSLVCWSYLGDGSLMVTLPWALDYPPVEAKTLYPYRPQDVLPLTLGLAILLAGWLWVGSGRAGATLRPYALTLPVATATPILLLPLAAYPSAVATVAGSVLVPLAMVPLAMDFIARLEGRRERWVVGSIVTALAVGSAVAGLLRPGDPFLQAWPAVLAAGVPLVPGVLAARPFHRPTAGAAVRSGHSPRALLESSDLALAAATPGVAAIGLIFPYGDYVVWPVLVWLFALLLTRIFTLRPLVRQATQVARQRDLVVAATETERARIAADIHDEALQDLTLLVRRLDAAGDKDNAEAARTIAARLRAICGDLRLPILEDLGVGPALEWLAARIDRLGSPVELRLTGSEVRLPKEVELAVYRVAQEALSNSVKHGAPPIVMRCSLRPAGVELEVDDAGPGLAPGAPDLAERNGHLGLSGMTQRAEAIGADLTVGPGPEGGTRVKLAWSAPAESPIAASPAPTPAPESR